MTDRDVLMVALWGAANGAGIACAAYGDIITGLILIGVGAWMAKTETGDQKR